jgi:3-oxoacyl-(acyl-carrier-protein) synthase
MSAMEASLPAGSVGSQAVDIDTRSDAPREAAYLRQAIRDALTAAGLSLAGDCRRRMLMLGTTLHGIRAGGRFLRNGDPAELEHFLANATNACAAEGMEFAGGVITTCSACSSGLGAIALATTLLRGGHADVVVAGGYDPISEYAWAGFSSLRLVARGDLRPFARGREGMKLGEGYAVVVLERANDAIARCAPVRAYVAGWGESADAHHLTQPLPTGDGAARAMHEAMQRAGVVPGEIGLAVAHATGTPDNDASEAAALATVLGNARGTVPVVGLKSHLGHTLGGAGAVELVLAAEAMREGVVLTCRQVGADAVEFEGLGVATGPSRAASISATLNSSLGFGGANTSVVLTPQPPRASRPSPPSRVVCITGIAALTAGGWPYARAADTRERVSIDDSSLGELLSGRRARRLSAYSKYTVAALVRAVADASLPAHALERASALLASMHGSPGYCFDYYSQIVQEGVMAANPVLFAEGVPNAAAAHVSALLGVRGACQTIIGSRTSGLDALSLGALRIREGASDVVLVAVAEEAHPAIDRAYEAALGAPLRSFAGACAFVLESAAHAHARDVRPWATVDASHWAWRPPARMTEAMTDVMQKVNTRCIAGTDAGTFLERVERLSARRCRVDIATREAAFIGEHFATTPLLVLADVLQHRLQRSGESTGIVCGDWLGACVGVRVTRADRERPGKEGQA